MAESKDINLEDIEITENDLLEISDSDQSQESTKTESHIQDPEDHDSSISDVSSCLTSDSSDRGNKDDEDGFLQLDFEGINE